MEFSVFDRRHYPVLPVAEGYSRWASTYEQTVLDRMDIALLERLKTVPWAGPAADLACGTGRIGAWLRSKGVFEIDGVDLTEAMLDRARARGIYRALLRGDIQQTLLPGPYALVTQSLACEHLPDLAPLYREVSRLLASGGRFVLVGYHPFFMMSGIPTHFREGASNLTIATHVHLLSDHFRAGRACELVLDEMDENLVDAGWLAEKPKWAAYEHHPISFVLVWRKGL